MQGSAADERTLFLTEPFDCAWTSGEGPENDEARGEAAGFNS